MFIPRYISPEQAALGYNNEGRGQLIGYAAVPREHEETCTYRISTGGNPDKNPHAACNCRLGLWQDTGVAKKHKHTYVTIKRCKICGKEITIKAKKK